MSLTTTLPFPFSCAGSGYALSVEEGKVIGNRKRQQHLFHHDNGITMAREVETAQKDQGHVSDCLSGVSD